MIVPSQVYVKANISMLPDVTKSAIDKALFFNDSHDKHDKCLWCGHEEHDKKACPARNAVCNYCSSKGQDFGFCSNTPWSRYEATSCAWLSQSSFQASWKYNNGRYLCPSTLLSYQASFRLGLVKFTVCEISKDIQGTYPSLFTGLGKLETEYYIKIDRTVEPYSVTTPRRVPLPLISSVKAELDQFQSLDVMMPVQESTPWCAPIVVVPKSNSRVCICVDLTRLSRVVQRERHIIPSVDHVLGQMSGAQVFTKLDANSGLHQMALSRRSQMLTTFITPFGRFAYKRISFGVSSGPEYFQREMSHNLEGLDGTECLMDDIVIFSRDQVEHDIRVRATMEKLTALGITLNKEKCEFSKSRIEFVGQIVGRNGITASPNKISAISTMPPPKDIHELRRFMGMVNH